jgi:hypothetical protein
MAATWSTLLALGAAAGGLATAWLGTKMVFCIDSATYILSAILLSRARIPQNTRSAEGPLWRQAFRDVIDGWSYLWRHPAVLRISLAKPAWAIGGGALVYMLTLLGDTVAASFALGVGILFSARGLGTGIGPIVARAVFRAEERWPAVMGGCVILSGLGYLVVGYIPWSLWILIPIVISHAASAANWVLSTVILQQRTEDAYRGRVFATEWLTLTLIDAVAIACSSTLLEAGHLSLRTGIRWAAVVQIVTGVLWWLLVIPRERRDPSVDAS